MILDHQGKSVRIAQALTARGCEIVSNAEAADAVLIDHDVPSHGKIRYAEACVAAGGRAFIYPHGADSAVLAGWDGLFAPSPVISGLIAPGGPGHAEVARRFGYPHPVHDIGWTMCELRPRRAPHAVENVLFAPLHPNGAGELSEWLVERNRDIFERLLATPARLTVRHIDELERNGIPRVEGVEYVQANLEDFAGQFAQIDAADVVVSDRSTFSSIAVARGATTVMFDASVIAEDLSCYYKVDHAELYREYARFPFEAASGVDIWELMNAAAQDSELVGEWRARFIGGPFDGDALLAVLLGDGAHLTPAVRVPRLHAAALASVERGDQHHAARLLSEAIVMSVDLELVNDLAVTWWNMGRAEDARSLLRACLAIEPAYEEASSNLTAMTALTG